MRIFVLLQKCKVESGGHNAYVQLTYLINSCWLECHRLVGLNEVYIAYLNQINVGAILLYGIYLCSISVHQLKVSACVSQHVLESVKSQIQKCAI